MNWTRWDGVSAKSEGKDQSYGVKSDDNSKFSRHYVLFKLHSGVFDSRPLWMVFCGWHMQVHVDDIIRLFRFGLDNMLMCYMV